jgi:hypothetical protein
MEYLRGADLVDLREYLMTGKSPKYAEQPLLGVWNLDKEAVFTNIRKANPDIKARDLANLRAVFELIPNISISATPDNKIYLQANAITPSETPADAPPPAEPDPITARYGAGARQGAAQPAPAQPAAPKAPGFNASQVASLPMTSGEGSWKEEAGQYILTLPGANGQPLEVPASVKDDQLLIQAKGFNVVLLKQEV